VNRARLFVISAPSGCGKGTVLSRAFENRPVFYSVSYTTREKREGEEEGKQYHFIDRRRFEKMIEDRDLLEYARYVDNYYGTPKLPVVENLARGNDVILEIETEGAFQVKKSYPDAVLVFILPPSLEALYERLKARGTEDDATIRKRVSKALDEIKHSYRYDYAIMNDDLDTAVKDLLEIVDSERNEQTALRHSTKEDDAVKLIEKVILDAKTSSLSNLEK